MSPAGPRIPPEEKLLRLIRGKPPSGDSGAPKPEVAVRSGGGSQAPGAWPFPQWLMTVVNVGLGCLVLAEVVILLMTVTSAEPVVDIPKPDPVTAQAQRAGIDAMPSLAASATRPIFEATQRPAAAAATQQPSTGPSVQARGVLSKLRVKGVMAGDAIIEDGETQQTSTVSKGQSLPNGAVVVDVQENKVVLELNGEKIELSF